MNNKITPLCKSLLQGIIPHFFCAFMLLALVASVNSHAIGLDKLIVENKLTIETTIKRDQKQIVGQPLTIAIEIATNRWFAKGTRINNFELADTIILANSEISINGTKRLNGQTWSTQTKEITLYPRRHGDYYLPSIKVQVSVNTENDGIVEGTIETKPQYFIISLPEALTNIEHFIVSPQVSLKILTDNENDDETSYSIGSAITQTITIKAQDVPAMMIPPVQQTELTGLSIYQKTPQVLDKSNRGDLVGTRIESFTYIFEQAGEYEIPEQVIFWWDTSNNKLQEVIIPSLLFNVGNSNTSKNNEANAFVLSFKQNILIIVIICITVGFFIFLFRYKNKLMILYANITHLEQRIIKKAFFQAISNHKYISAVDYLYKYSLLIGVNLDQVKSTQILSLNKLAFDNNNQSTSFTLQNAKELIKELTKDKEITSNRLDSQKTIKLNNQF